MVKLPVRFNPVKLVDDGATYEVVIPVRQFARFSELLESPSGEVQIQVSFARDGNGRVVATGRYKLTCELLCQRCLQVYEQPLAADFSLTFVADESAAKALPDDYDPVILDEHGSIHSIDMLEDELILRLPVAPKHVDESVCESLGYPGEAALTEADSTEAKESGRKNPFDVLKDFSKPD